MKYFTNNENKEHYKKESSDLEDEYENKKTRKIGISWQSIVWKEVNAAIVDRFWKFNKFESYKQANTLRMLEKRFTWYSRMVQQVGKTNIELVRRFRVTLFGTHEGRGSDRLWESQT